MQLSQEFLGSALEVSNFITDFITNIYEEKSLRNESQVEMEEELMQYLPFGQCFTLMLQHSLDWCGVCRREV